MKTLTNYIFENTFSLSNTLILEADKYKNGIFWITDEIIDLVIKNDKNILIPLEDLSNIFDYKKFLKDESQNKDDLDIRTVKVGLNIEDAVGDVYVSLSPEYASNQCNKGKNDQIYIVIDTNDGFDEDKLRKLDDTIAHELRHSCDYLTDKGDLKCNGTYGENGELMDVFNNFLYAISYTEQKAFHISFAKKLKRDEIKKGLKLAYKEIGANNVKDFAEKFAENAWQVRNGILKNDSKNESEILTPIKTQLSKSDNSKDIIKAALLNSPIRFLEYKNTILENLNTFKSFITNDTISGDKREPKDIKIIVASLNKYAETNPIVILYDNDGNCNINKEGLEEVYNKIIDVYNETYNDYIDELEEALKEENIIDEK